MRRIDVGRDGAMALGLIAAAFGFGGCGGNTGDGTARSGTPDVPDAAPGTGGDTSGTGGQGPGGGSSAGGASGCTLGCGPVAQCFPPSRSYTPPGACCPMCVSDCNGVRCASPKCAAGSTPYTPPDQCCPVCGPDCSLVDCVVPVCPPGSKIVQSPGQCCGSCMSFEAGAPVCNPGIDAFVAGRIAALDALSCTTSSDCVIASLGGQCRLDCGTAVNLKSSGALFNAVAAYSSANCTGCPQTNIACPPVIYTPECQNGQCTRVP